jgi:integrase
MPLSVVEDRDFSQIRAEKREFATPSEQVCYHRHSGEPRSMDLTEYVERRYALENDISEESVTQLCIRARQLTRFAGGVLPLASLTDDLVNNWLVLRQKSGLSPDTVHGDRAKILAIWRAAAEAELCAPPGKVRRIKRPRKIPRAFTHEAIVALLHVARRLRGTMKYKRADGKWHDTGVLRRLYWPSWINAAYDCGLRRSNQMIIERNWIMPYEGGGILGVTMPKTGRTIVIRFRPDTMADIDALCNGRTTGPIWFDYPTRRVWCQAFKRLCKSAGVDGTAKWLRRSGASYTAREYGREAAKRFLGHASDTVADASYIDPLIACPAPVLPPRPY